MGSSTSLFQSDIHCYDKIHQWAISGERMSLRSQYQMLKVHETRKNEESQNSLYYEAGKQIFLFRFLFLLFLVHRWPRMPWNPRSESLITLRCVLLMVQLLLNPIRLETRINDREIQVSISTKRKLVWNVKAFTFHPSVSDIPGCSGPWYSTYAMIHNLYTDHWWWNIWVEMENESLHRPSLLREWSVTSSYTISPTKIRSSLSFQIHPSFPSSSVLGLLDFHLHNHSGSSPFTSSAATTWAVHSFLSWHALRHKFKVTKNY